MKISKNFINTYGLQNINLKKNDKINILNHFNQNLITNGKFCKKFETKISKKIKSKYTVVCNNGTSALMMSILSLDIKNLVVIIPNINFVAAANIVLLLKGKIILCDVNKETGMIDYKNFINAVELSKQKKLKPNLFIPVDFAGDVMDLSNISKYCKKNDIKIIEDGCHSFGSYKKIRKKKIIVGQNQFSNMTTFSFHPVKNLTTIEGGAITTDNKKIYEKLLLLRSHNLKKTSISDPYKLINPSLNFRLGEINALIGLQQLSNLEIQKKIRNKLVKLYLKLFSKEKFIFKLLNYEDNGIFWHIAVIKINKKFFNCKKNLMHFLKKEGIGIQIHYKPLHLHFLKNKNVIFNKIDGSNYFYKSALTIPLHTKLNQKSIVYIVKKISRFFKNKS